MLENGSKGNDQYLRGHPSTKGLFLHLRCGLRCLDPCSVLDVYFVQVQILLQWTFYTLNTKFQAINPLVEPIFMWIALSGSL
jgi:hypothetical protein